MRLRATPLAAAGSLKRCLGEGRRRDRRHPGRPAPRSSRPKKDKRWSTRTRDARTIDDAGDSRRRARFVTRDMSAYELLPPRVAWRESRLGQLQRASPSHKRCAGESVAVTVGPLRRLHACLRLLFARRSFARAASRSRSAAMSSEWRRRCCEAGSGCGPKSRQAVCDS